MTEEKRRNPRFACLDKNRFQVASAGEEQPGYLLNFSRDGLAFETHQTPPEKSEYAFTISGRGLSSPIAGSARIAWVSAGDMQKRWMCGARITQMQTADKIDLIEILYQDWKSTIENNNNQERS